MNSSDVMGASRVILPELSSDSRGKFLQLPPAAEVWKWNFTRLELDERPKLVLLGESAAAGFFYRPQITFGLILQEHYPQYQVIDLSCVSLQYNVMSDWQPLMAQIKPHHIFFYGGNNHTINDRDEQLIAPVSQTLEWLYHTGAEVTMIVPSFNELHWPALAGRERRAPNLPLHLKKQMLDLAKKYPGRVIDVSTLKENICDLMMDYCHMRMEGLLLLAQKLSGKSCAITVSEDVKRVAHHNAFFHVYQYGRYELALFHLKEYQKYVDPKVFTHFVTSFLSALLTSLPPHLSEEFLTILPQNTDDGFYTGRYDNQFRLYLPDPDFIARLMEQVPAWKALPAKTTSLNLLEDRRYRENKALLWQTETLQVITLTDSFKTRWFKQEIGQSCGLEIIIEGELKEMVLELNGHRLWSGQLKGILELKLNLPENVLADFNQLVLLASPEVRIHRLRLKT